MDNEVWVLGATGRAGRAIAIRLHERGVPVVLVGRDRGRLEAVAAGLDGTPRLLVGTLESVLVELARDAPAVVVNTVGPFTRTAPDVAGACPPGTHYVDIANELPAAEAILGLDGQAVAAGQVLVTGAGFGVLATESVVLRLCDGQPPASRVRVDAIASVATEPGLLGAALASTIVEGLPAGGRQIRQGRLVRARLGAAPAQLKTPDGDVVTTASLQSGELLAAWRASGADAVVAASSEVPAGRVARLLIPVVSVLFRVSAVAGFATRRLAKVAVPAHDRPRASSWARAQVQWASGTSREGWLGAGDGMDFTAAVAAEVTHRLLAGEGRPGAHTPGTLFGASLAESAGGKFVLAQDNRASHDA